MHELVSIQGWKVKNSELHYSTSESYESSWVLYPPFRLIMGERIFVFFLVLVFCYLSVVVAETVNNDFLALTSLSNSWQNKPPNWEGLDPCGDEWDGIRCTNSHVTSITLLSMNLTGQLSGDIGFLSELVSLDLSYNKGLTGPLPQAIGNLKKLSILILVGCGFTGPIPDTIGNLPRLLSLSLNSNGFHGQIPPSIGNLSKLYWLDLADNQLDGPIPVSNGTIPGLDMLHSTKHFHLGQNKLSGTIPPQLFSSNMTLIHVLFESNGFTGSIPSTLGLVRTLEVVRLDHNSFSGPVPQNLNNLTNVQELFLSDNKLSGPLPNLTGMSVLSYLDMSINSFDQSDFPPWFSTLKSLTTLMMANTQLRGQIPVSFFSLAYLQTVVLKDNQVNGTLDIGTSNSNQLELIDLQNNLIDNFRQSNAISNVTIILANNPVCQGAAERETYCSVTQPNISYITPPSNCVPVTCISDRISSPNCKCAYPYTGTLIFRAPSFSDLGNTSYYTTLAQSLMISFQSQHLPVDSVSLSNPIREEIEYLELTLQIFPLNQDHFNRTGISNIGFVLSNQTFKPPHIFGPFYFDGEVYQHFGGNGISAIHIVEFKLNILISTFQEEPTKSSKSSNIGIIIGAAAGGSALLLLSLLLGVYAFRVKKKAKKAIEESNNFGHSNSSIPQLKGARRFSFEEIQKYTKKFSEANDIGSGGYGKVYRGTLPNGQLVAIKRAQRGSLQGGPEFRTEIELLSRVHHKNLVSLVGYCFEQGEQMLVYEYIPNGTLKDTFSGKSGIRLDWIRRLKIALGTARGLAYLHELANPPIIHRDIKSANILLDERLNAKVADFGLCKPMGDGERDHVTTQVKGTMGYLDPEYYMTQQLSEKSDIYSFGVLMLEIITGKRPIERGKYIVREVRNAIDETKDLYGLQKILDPAIGSGRTLKGLEKFVDLAMKCVAESGIERPTMSDVVKEIENVLQSAGSNPTAESSSTSASYEEVSKGSSHHPYSNELFG